MCLANKSLSPSKLRTYSDTKHLNLREKPIDYFESLKNKLHTNQKVIKIYSFIS